VQLILSFSARRSTARNPKASVHMLFKPVKPSGRGSSKCGLPVADQSARAALQMLADGRLGSGVFSRCHCDAGLVVAELDDLEAHRVAQRLEHFRQALLFWNEYCGVMLTIYRNLRYKLDLSRGRIIL